MINKISKYRNEIDNIDKKIVELLNKRAQAALQIGKIKGESSKEVYVPAREKQVIRRSLASARGRTP